MRNRVSKTLPLAVAVLLLGAGVALAGQNAGATFSLSTPTEYSGIGGGEAGVIVTVDAAGMSGVKQFDVTLAVVPADAFDLAATAYAGPANFIAPGTEVDQVAGTVKVGAANFFGAMDGSGTLGTFTLTTAAGFTPGTTATVTVQRVSLGPSSSDRDVFEAAALGLEVTVNPPAPAPTVDSIAPATGSVVGGTAVVLSGANFVDGAAVTFGGVAAASVTFVDAATLNAVTPAAAAAGAVDVVVTNPDAQAATLAAGFTYQAVIEPTLAAAGGTSFVLDYSAIGGGAVGDGSAGEVTLAVSFTDATGGAAAGQDVTFTVTHNGGESVYVVSPGGQEIAALATVAVVATTDANGVASIVVDAEGGKDSESTSISVTASTSAANSDGVSRDLAIDFAATWDVPVVAEMAAFAGSVTPAGAVVLQWSVVSQTSNLGWEVQRSTDNVVFEQVGELVPGAGTSDAYLSYTFTDTDVPAVGVLYYRLNQVDLDGATHVSQVIELSLSDAMVVPTSMALLQNYPNPFNPETTIAFDVSTEAVVTLRVFDLTGQVVRTLVEGQSYAPGRHQVLWNGRSENGARVASGVYFYQLTAAGYSSLRKMTLLQ